MVFDIDIQSVFRNKIDSLLTTASWTEELKQLLGITGVSPVWDDVPAWYFWIDGAPGVYALVLEEAFEKTENASTLHGLFSLKCYPFSGREEFAGFSFVERELVTSKFFDATNTPQFEHRASIPSSLFVIGAVECVLDRENRWSLFTLESQDLMRARYEAEILEDYPLIDLSRFYCSGDVGRSIQAWDVSYLLFDRIVSLWAHFGKKSPSKVVLERSFGFEHVYTDSGEWSCQESPDREIRSLSVLFGESPGQGTSEAIFRNDPPTPGVTVLYPSESQCSCPTHDHQPSGVSPYMNCLWWTIPESNFTSELSSPCGCS
ncbi:hypothetical protein [Desulfomonile tiedjei]|uniref:Uncharacterized protein n=1 Tax=Desulfomonile tiedjei (strain ATCC 49306 / DSM 6799 / DCB-1) TaxID=706587 RepID=I4CCY0_DESTA|nr:hypothetical protein [Desulfomonile tiedjei]AFM27421.1 hypothetical protein Desti_4805 [Desulfomonile tiedjei DSM 6799]